MSGSGIGSTCTSARGSIGETGRAYCPHNECCHTHEEQEPAELKKIKKVKKHRPSQYQQLTAPMDGWPKITERKYLYIFFSRLFRLFRFSFVFECTTGAKLFSWLVMPTPMEANCGQLH